MFGDVGNYFTSVGQLVKEVSGEYFLISLSDSFHPVKNSDAVIYTIFDYLISFY